MSKTNFIKKPNIVSEADLQEYLQYLSTVADEVDNWLGNEKSPRSALYHDELVKIKDKP